MSIGNDDSHAGDRAGTSGGAGAGEPSGEEGVYSRSSSPPVVVGDGGGGGGEQLPLAAGQSASKTATPAVEEFEEVCLMSFCGRDCKYVDGFPDGLLSSPGKLLTPMTLTLLLLLWKGL